VPDLPWRAMAPLVFRPFLHETQVADDLNKDHISRNTPDENAGNGTLSHGFLG